MERRGPPKDAQTECRLGVSKLTRLFGVLALFRVANTFLVRTAFDPDEYWQGPEVAHRVAFGYGHLTWEWWPENALRGYLHPLLFAPLYKLLALCSLDTPFLVQWSPRILQSLMATLGDVSLYVLATSLAPKDLPDMPGWVLCCAPFSICWGCL